MDSDEVATENALIEIISLGAGVQSSTMALMAEHGEINPLPECAIFADTGWEPKAVYDWLDELEGLLSFPVYRVGDGMLREEQITAHIGRKATGSAGLQLPYFTKANGAVTIGRVKRQCTSKYKIEPIERFIKREILGLRPRQHAPKVPVIRQWRGISCDEASRAKPSREQWMSVHYPLIDLGMKRHDCLLWMERHGYPAPPRSACIGCPFHSNHEWRDMKINRPDEWRDAVQFDTAIRKAGGIRGDTFLHRTCAPLSEVDLRNGEDYGQIDMFKNECEGMCGL